MPTFMIESTRFVPEHRLQVLEAETATQACDQAIENDEWSGATRSADTPGETHITGIWCGSRADLRGPTMEIPSRFRERLSRKAEHFPVLVDLLWVLSNDSEEVRRDIAYWRCAAVRAIAMAEAILAGVSDPLPTSSPERDAPSAADLRREP